MKYIVLLIITAISLSATAQCWDVNIFGSYTKPIESIHGEGILAKKELTSSGESLGIGATYMFNDRIGINTSFTFSSQYLMFKKISDINYRGYFVYDMSIVAKTNIVSFGEFTIYSKEGIAFSYFDGLPEVLGSSWGGNPLNPYFTTTGTSYSNFSFGVSAGIGLSYLIKERFMIDVYAIYVQGTNKLHNITSLKVYQDGMQVGDAHGIIRGSSLRVGLGFGYRFNRK